MGDTTDFAELTQCIEEAVASYLSDAGEGSMTHNTSSDQDMRITVDVLKLQGNSESVSEVSREQSHGEVNAVQADTGSDDRKMFPCRRWQQIRTRRPRNRR